MSPSKAIEMSRPKGTDGSSIMKAGNSPYIVEGKGDSYPKMIIRQDIFIQLPFSKKPTVPGTVLCTRDKLAWYCLYVIIDWVISFLSLPW